jgi:hypothetical protein
MRLLHFFTKRMMSAMRSSSGNGADLLTEAISK